MSAKITKISILPKIIPKISINLAKSFIFVEKFSGSITVEYNGPLLQRTEILNTIASLNEIPENVNKEQINAIAIKRIMVKTQTFRMTELLKLILEVKILTCEG